MIEAKSVGKKNHKAFPAVFLFKKIKKPEVYTVLCHKED